VVAPEFLHIISETLPRRDPKTWVSLLRTRALDFFGASLDARFQQAKFNLEREKVVGYQLPSRTQTCIAATTAALPSLTDMIYDSKYDSEEDNEVGSALLHRVRRAFIARLARAPWLDNATRRIALAKAQRLLLNIGSPKDYTLIRFPITGSYFNNSEQASRARVIQQMMAVDLPVDREQWKFPADTVDAWYDDKLNAAFVPAGILMAPFFKASYSAARNLGGIGTVVGHELTHGFDTQGAAYNEVGELEMWWSPATAATFANKVECIAQLYNGYQIDGTPVDGYHTLGENIADMGGVTVALEALRDMVRAREGEAAAAPAANELRLFFLTYGQLWCEKERLQNRQFMVLRDIHAPKRYRVNGVLSQNDAFAEAFQCPARSPMNPPSKCSLW